MYGNIRVCNISRVEETFRIRGTKVSLLLILNWPRFGPIQSSSNSIRTLISSGVSSNGNASFPLFCQFCQPSLETIIRRGDTVRWKARLEKIKATNNHSSLIRVWSKYGGLIRKKIARSYPQLTVSYSSSTHWLCFREMLAIVILGIYQTKAVIFAYTEEILPLRFNHSSKSKGKTKFPVKKSCSNETDDEIISAIKDPR